MAWSHKTKIKFDKLKTRSPRSLKRLKKRTKRDVYEKSDPRENQNKIVLLLLY